MNGFVKFVLWMIVLSVLGYFGYQAYTKWWDADTVNQKKEQITETLESAASSTKGGLVEKTGQAKEKINEYTSQVVGEAREGALNFVKGKIGEGIAVIGESIVGLGNDLTGEKDQTQVNPVSISNIVQNYYSTSGGVQVSTNQIPAPTSSSYFKPPSSTSIIAGINVPLVFSINSNVSYHVDWGDGNKEEGIETSGNIKLLSHAWKEKGDYNVKFSVTNSSTMEYSFPIRVY